MEQNDFNIQLLPDEYVRFEYKHRSAFFSSSSKTTIVTNMRIITRIVEVPRFFSMKTGVGRTQESTVFFKDLENIDQLRPGTLSNQKRCWTNLCERYFCLCDDDPIDWSEICRNTSSQKPIYAEPVRKKNSAIPKILIEKFWKKTNLLVLLIFENRLISKEKKYSSFKNFFQYNWLVVKIYKLLGEVLF